MVPVLLCVVLSHRGAGLHIVAKLQDPHARSWSSLKSGCSLERRGLVRSAGPDEWWWWGDSGGAADWLTDWLEATAASQPASAASVTEPFVRAVTAFSSHSAVHCRKQHTTTTTLTL